MTKAIIATPIGIFKAGPTGVGGQIERMTPAGIRRDFFQRLPEGLIYGLAVNAGPDAPNKDSMIMDVIYDAGSADEFTLLDPHLDHTIQQVTDYPVDQAKRGIAWFCGAKVPGYTRYSKVGPHSLTVRVAPRAAPLQGGTTTTIIPPPGTMKKVTITTESVVPALLNSCGQVIVPEHTVVTYATKEVPVEPTTDYVGYSVKQDLGPRDFSPEAGGVTKTFTFRIYDENGPAIPEDE